jgi:OOP family OmpA-OmpF porin
MRNRVAVTASILALMLSGVAVAQTAPTPPPKAPAKAPDAALSADEIDCQLTGVCGSYGVEATDGQQGGKEAAFSIRPATFVGKLQNVPAKPAAGVKTASIAPTPMPVSARAAATPKPAGLNMRVTFNNGSAVLTPAGRANVEAVADRLVHNPKLAERKFLVEGHTDAVGSRDYNVALSESRAQAVAEYMQSLGVSPDRILTHGYGFDKPLGGLAPTNGMNRRVEIVPAPAS